MCSFWDQIGCHGFVTWWVRVLFKVPTLRSVQLPVLCALFKMFTRVRFGAEAWTGQSELSSEEAYFTKLHLTLCHYPLGHSFISLIHKHCHTEDVPRDWKGFKSDKKKQPSELRVLFLLLFFVYLFFICLFTGNHTVLLPIKSIMDHTQNPSTNTVHKLIWIIA